MDKEKLIDHIQEIAESTVEKDERIKLIRERYRNSKNRHVKTPRVRNKRPRVKGRVK